ncbi:MAG TPA: NADH-quinone oxidoreductase subunit L [Chitinophagaceae bacterium]|nr:NADH-quinone oxidoreductase subunit L [Chitinophagaceae bacterium]
MNNVLDIVWLIPLLPLIGFLVNGMGRKVLPKSVSGFFGSLVVLAAFLLSCLVFIQVKNGQTHTAHLFDFIRIDSLKIGFEFTIDQLSSLFLLIITGIGFLIHVYSTAYMHDEPAPDFAKYFAYLNLFVFSMLLLVMGGNLVVMFIGWEGVGLCSYLLIGYWFKKNDYTNAAKKAFVMNRIGDLGFLLAIFWLIAKTGHVDYQTIFSQATLDKLSQADITGITLLLFLGATGKSAQIPLYTWLPDAMAGPTPVSALIHAATMVTAGIYMVARSHALFSLAEFTQTIIAITGLATALLAASIAIRQNDIKKVLAYSTVSQLGFMFLALGTGNYVAAVFHVLTHAFFKALMFLGSGSVIHAMGGEQDIRKMGGLHKHMKVTSITFFIGCLAIAGIPGFSGFFSKDEILAGTYAHAPWMFALALFAALMTAFYMFRLYILTFTGTFRGSEEQEQHLHESPSAMTIPLVVLAVLSVVGGYIGIPAALGGNHWLAAFLKPATGEVAHHLDHGTEYALMGISTLLVLASIGFAWFKFKSYQAEDEPTGFAKILVYKWYVDEFYDAAIVKPIRSVSGIFDRLIEKKGIDGFVNGIGRAVNYGGRQLRWLQSGQVGAYILLMVIGMLLLFIIQFYL